MKNEKVAKERIIGLAGPCLKTNIDRSRRDQEKQRQTSVKMATASAIKPAMRVIRCVVIDFTMTSFTLTFN